MNRALSPALVLVVGFLLGAIGMNLLELHVRPIYRESLRASLLVEQELLAAREAREGDRMRAAVHRWNTVDAHSPSPDGFRIFRPEWSEEGDGDFWLPFRLLALKHMVSNADAESRGHQLVEAQYRAKLALALEALHENRAAAEQWELASRLEGRPIEAVRRYAESSLESENSDRHREAEAATLDQGSLMGTLWETH